MKKQKSPEIINLPAGQLDEIKTRFESGFILEEDKKIILLILSTYAWLYRQLQAKKLGIQRLRSLFGFNTEKRSNLKKKDDGSNSPDLNNLSGGNVTPLKKFQNGTRSKTMAD